MVFRKMPLLPKLYKFYRDHGISKTLRCLLLFYYRRLKRLLTNFAKEHVIEVNGYKLSTIPNDRGWYADELILFKTHEPLATELLKKELKKGMVCLDIGSHIGYYSLLERKLVGGEGRVIAVEPSPLNFSYLKKNVSQNGFDDIEIFNFAFSNFDGEVNFLIASERSNICRVVEGNGPSIIKVYARSLDSFVTQYHLNRLDFLRMDVEGYEVEIINGGRWTIERFHPLLLIEVHAGDLRTTINLLKNLKRAGYEVKYYIPRELNKPLIGSMNDVQEIDISQLIEKLSKGLLSDCFHLFLATQ